MGWAEGDLGGRVVLGLEGGQRQGGCTEKWGFESQDTGLGS